MEPELYFSRVYILLHHYHMNPSLVAHSPQISELIRVCDGTKLSPQRFFPKQYFDNEGKRLSLYTNTRKSYRLVYTPDSGLQLQHHSVVTDSICSPEDGRR